MFAKIILIIAAITTAIMAGLFFAWSFSVMPGLAKVTDREFIASMQAMNKAIQNPVFLVFFLGAAIMLPIATAFHYQRPLTMVFWLLLIATVIYLVGVMGVTFLGNIPLNNSLDAFQLDGATTETMAGQRTAFESPWVRLNFVRTASSFVSILLLIIACLMRTEE